MTDPAPTPAILNYPSPGTCSPQRPLGRTVVRTIALLCIFGLLFLGIFAFVPRSSTTRNSDGTLIVSILQPALDDLLCWLLPAGFLLLLVTAILLLARRRFRLGSLFLLTTICVSFWAMLAGGVRHLARWTICDQVTAPNGTQYCFIDSSFLQGQTMAIARIKSTNWLYMTLEAYGTTNGDSPRSYLLVVRPAPPKPVSYGALHLANQGRLLVGLRYDNRCFLAYDIPNKQFFGHGDIEKLSPFLLLDDKSPPHAPDEADIVKTMRIPGSMGLPTREPLTDALTHPNPAVRQAADKMLKAMKP